MLLRRLSIIGFWALLIMVPSEMLASEPAQRWVIEPGRITSVSSQTRTTIPISVSNSERVKEIRCYFKPNLGQHWFFTEASFEGLNKFACEAPIFTAGIKWVDHRLLLVGDNDQVIRSKLYRLPVSAVERSLLFYHVPSQLEVFSDINGEYRPYIRDSRVEYSTLETGRTRYGLISGLYSSTQIPLWLGAVEGYFGGLEYDSNSHALYSVKGFAPELSELGRSLRLTLPLNIARPSASIPNIAGDDWAGYFETIDFGNRQNLSSDVSQSGGNVTLITSKSGIANHFVGTINSSGDMLVYDQSDGEDWTTHLGPANETSIGLYDFVRPPTSSDPNPPLNSVILGRVLIPGAPSSVSASDGTSIETISISWADVQNASYFLIYRCTTSATSSCSLIKNTSALSTTDVPVDRSVYYYRAKACNTEGCGVYSASNTGYLAAINITGVIMLLLFD